MARARLVLVDGVFAPSLSEIGGLEKGLGIRTLREVLEAGDATAAGATARRRKIPTPMVALNSAMMTDGVVIEVADGAALTQPLHIVHIASGADACGDVHALAAEARQGRQRHAGGKLYRRRWRESLSGPRLRSSFRSATSARLDHVRLIEDSREAFNISSAVGDARRASPFQHVRHDQRRRMSAAIRRCIAFAGEGSRVETNGVNLLNGRQHADTTLFLDHAVPNCESREIFRAVVDDRGHSVFQGRIIVRPDAQKTDAKMMTRALLLSDEAEADNKPELEIFADDVTCGHGATTGALDESLLFYLRARGLPEKEAQALLIQAFVGEAIESIASDALRELAISAAQRWLAARG